MILSGKDLLMYRLCKVANYSLMVAIISIVISIFSIMLIVLS